MKGGDKEQHIRLWIEKCQGDFREVGLVSYFINDLQESTENKFTNSAADTELGVTDTRQTENNSLGELEIMKKPNLYFYKSELVCLGGKKKTKLKKKKSQRNE